MKTARGIKTIATICRMRCASKAHLCWDVTICLAMCGNGAGIGTIAINWGNLQTRMAQNARAKTQTECVEGARGMQRHLIARRVLEIAEARLRATTS